ncbi:hypothetical protein LMH87_005959 [Akanthomyces muscarius]|uniref:Uncharacterized protein n=1 Tax=Akanthomyces muscarius TaxID=2231603 RepID=A0A9W8QLS5_AKAMU|nr:hypothetical protein LMH87_005959 [Akanthomyces muscarius]KAJ4164281.1 hypothetical protein LMH87_005959 [Akanthomyces muscarius]
MDVFAGTSEKHLRAILVALCQDPNILAKATRMADNLEEAAEQTGSDSDMSEADLAICCQCEEAFSEDKNEGMLVYSIRA